MVRLNLCRIPEFLKDYKNVLDFESKQEQLTWMNTHIVTTIDCNARTARLMRSEIDKLRRVAEAAKKTGIARL